MGTAIGMGRGQQYGVELNGWGLLVWAWHTAWVGLVGKWVGVWCACGWCGWAVACMLGCDLHEYGAGPELWAGPCGGVGSGPKS